MDLQDPVYQLLELGELKGALSRLSAVRPYSRSRVVALLQALWESRFKFTAAEQNVLAGTLQRFGEEPSGLRHGNLTFRQGGEGAKKLQVGADVRSRFRLNANSPENWHMDSVVRPYLRGDLVPWLSYLGVLGFTLDRVRADEAFAPYGFSKQWDAIHLSFGEPRYSDGQLDYPTISYNLRDGDHRAAAPGQRAAELGAPASGVGHRRRLPDPRGHAPGRSWARKPTWSWPHGSSCTI